MRMEKDIFQSPSNQSTEFLGQLEQLGGQSPQADSSSLPYLLGLVSGIFLERFKSEQAGVLSRKAAQYLDYLPSAVDPSTNKIDYAKVDSILDMIDQDQRQTEQGSLPQDQNQSLPFQLQQPPPLFREQSQPLPQVQQSFLHSSSIAEHTDQRQQLAQDFNTLNLNSGQDQFSQNLTAGQPPKMMQSQQPVNPINVVDPLKQANCDNHGQIQRYQASAKIPPVQEGTARVGNLLGDLFDDNKLGQSFDLGASDSQIPSQEVGTESLQNDLIFQPATGDQMLSKSNDFGRHQPIHQMIPRQNTIVAETRPQAPHHQPLFPPKEPQPQLQSQTQEKAPQNAQFETSQLKANQAQEANTVTTNWNSMPQTWNQLGSLKTPQLYNPWQETTPPQQASEQSPLLTMPPQQNSWSQVTWGNDGGQLHQQAPPQRGPQQFDQRVSQEQQKIPSSIFQTVAHPAPQQTHPTDHQIAAGQPGLLSWTSNQVLPPQMWNAAPNAPPLPQPAQSQAVASAPGLEEAKTSSWGDTSHVTWPVQNQQVVQQSCQSAVENQKQIELLRQQKTLLQQIENEKLEAQRRAAKDKKERLERMKRERAEIQRKKKETAAKIARQKVIEKQILDALDAERLHRQEEEARMLREQAMVEQEKLFDELVMLEKRKTEEYDREVCQVCQESLFTADYTVYTMSVCSDVYHAECIKPWLTSCMESGNLPITCPETKCKLPIPLTDLQELLTREELERCQKFEWKKVRDQNPDMEECPTDGCDYLFLLDSDDETYFICPACQQEYCLKCKVPYHTDLSCNDYQRRKAEAELKEKVDRINNNQLPEDDQLFNWARSVGAKKCSRCNYYVQKNDGCNHMTCRCGHQFCYVCGGPYPHCHCRR